jgi:hypothetical protein
MIKDLVFPSEYTYSSMKPPLLSSLVLLSTHLKLDTLEEKPKDGESHTASPHVTVITTIGSAATCMT